jgi:hypothetical protein
MVQSQLQANSSRSYLLKTHHKKRAGGVAQTPVQKKKNKQAGCRCTVSPPLLVYMLLVVRISQPDFFFFPCGSRD